MNPEPVEFVTRDGYRLSGRWFAAPHAKAVALLNSATGFPQGFYYKFANYCAERGYDTLVYDYRGIGESARLPLAEEPAVMSDWARLDMPAALTYAHDRARGRPCFTIGHSIGGQVVGMLANHSLARAHVFIAVSTGYWRWSPMPFRYVAWYFWNIHGPLTIAARGYVPRGIGWSGLPLPRGVFYEWRKWCTRPSHFGADLGSGSLPDHFATVREPILAMSFSDDPIATPRTVACLLDFYAKAPVEARHYSPQQVGSKRIAHEGYFAARHREALWAPTLDWLDARCAAVPPMPGSP